MTLSVDNRFLRKSIERALRDLPALPTVVLKVLEETEKPNASAASVERLLLSDQALTIKVLRVVNSAYYGLSGQVTSLSQAVVILGIQQVRNLVLSIGAISSLNLRTQAHQEMRRHFWIHAFGTAAAAQIISRARRMPVRDAETVFIGGLLHDVGRLFLFCTFTEIYDDIVRYAIEQQMPICEAESKFLGMTHGQVGEEMAKAWRLPQLLSSIIASHEGPFHDDGAPLAFTVHLADHVMRQRMPEPGLTAQGEPDPIAMRWLAFTPEEWQQLGDETLERVEEGIQTFAALAA